MSGNIQKGKMDISKLSNWQEVPLPPLSVINSIGTLLGVLGEIQCHGARKLQTLGADSYCKTIWRKRHLSTAPKLTFKNNSQVFHIKNCKLQLKIKEDRKLMKIHFGKQWRQLEKCIIQCQETAQGSKPEPQLSTDWSVSTISCWKWVGEERACSTFLQTATIFHSMKDFGDIYFQNYSWTPSIEHLPLNSFLLLQHGEMLTLDHNKWPASSGLRRYARVETGTGTSEEQTQSILNYSGPLQLLGNDQDLLTCWRIALHGFWNVQGLAAAWTASFNTLVNQQPLLRLNSLPAHKYFICDYFSLWRVSIRGSI